MANANYSNGGISPSTSSSRTDPITLNSIVSASGSPLAGLSNSVIYQAPITDNFTSTGAATYTLSHISPNIISVTVNGAVQTAGATEDYTLAGQVITFTSGNIPASGDLVTVVYNTSVEFVLGSGNYNFTAGQMTLTGGGATAASRLQIGPDTTASDPNATVLVGYNNVAIPSDPTDVSHIINEDFVLNFDDADLFGIASQNVNGRWNYYVRNSAVLDISEGNRMVVNLPRRMTFSENAATRNTFMVENNRAASNIRMTVNMGAYANDVLYSNLPNTDTSDDDGGGPALANSLQLYELTSAVPVRDILYRGDYVDWRPRIGSTTWAPLTAGGFIGDNGIKWLIENQTDAVVSENRPLVFGTLDATFELGVGGDLIPSNGNGYFELGLSPDAANPRINRVVFRNVRGLDWNTRMGLWNFQRGRLRVEHHTAQPFHIFDDTRVSLKGARVVVNHFYPTYTPSDIANPTTFFDRNVSSTAVTPSSGRVNIGIDDASYFTMDSSTTTNRPIIIEAVELNNQPADTGGGDVLIQNAYQSSAGSGNVAHNVYTQRSTTTTNAATYDVYAYGHEPSIGNGLSWIASGATTGGTQLTIEVPLQRDTNVVIRDETMVPTRAANLENVYDMLSLWAFQNRQAHPATVLGPTVNFGARVVTFNPSTDASNVLSVTNTTMNIPTNTTLTPGGNNRFSSIRVTGNGRIVSAGVSYEDGLREIGANDPTINITGLNESPTANNVAGRLDIYDSTGNAFSDSGFRSLTQTDGSTSRLLMSVTDGTQRQVTISRDATFDIGALGSIDDLTIVYSRPGFLPNVIDVDVSDDTNHNITITELPRPYPETADLTALSQPTWVSTPSYAGTTTSGVLTAALSGGGTNNTLSDTQLNRLLMESVYGSLAFNQFLYSTANIFAMGSENRDSYWFADSNNFQLSTSGRVIRVGYIDNTATQQNPPTFSTPTTVTDTDGNVGQSGVFHSDEPSRFNLSAVRDVNSDQTTLLVSSISTSISSLAGDTAEQIMADDNSTLREVRNNIQAARNTILGNL